MSFTGGTHFYSEDLKELFKFLEKESQLDKLTLKDYPFFINNNDAFFYFSEFLRNISTFDYMSLQAPIEKIR